VSGERRLKDGVGNVEAKSADACVHRGEIGDQSDIGGPFQDANGPDDGQPSGLGLAPAVEFVDKQGRAKLGGQADRRRLAGVQVGEGKRAHGSLHRRPCRQASDERSDFEGRSWVPHLGSNFGRDDDALEQPGQHVGKPDLNQEMER